MKVIIDNFLVMILLKKNPYSYPAMLKLEGRRCVIVGGGRVAARKLASLGEAGADLTAVAPEFCSQLTEAAAKYRCRLVRDVYRRSYLENAFIVIAATDSAAVNRQVSADAPCLCNNVTEPELSSFTVPSAITEGRMLFTVATGGVPAYTRLLKSYLQQKITPAFSDFNEFLHEQRAAVKDIPSSPTDRTAFWRGVLTQDILNLLEAGHTAKAKEKILNAVNSFRAQSQNSSR